MSETTHAAGLEQSTFAAIVSPIAGMRVDPAHVMANAPEQAPPPQAPGRDHADVDDAAPAEAWAIELLPRLRLQGRQLAQLLEERRKDLDRREAQQQAQAACLDNQMRAARLWLAERHQELSEREARIAERERRVANLSSQLTAAEAYHESARLEAAQSIERSEQALDRRQAELERLQTRLESQASACDVAQQEVAEHRRREHERLVYERQQIDSHRADSMTTIRQAAADLERRRAAIEADAAALEQARAAMRETARRPSPEQREIARELDQIAQRMAAREQKLDAAEQAQVRAEEELVALRRELHQERQRMAEQARTDRQELAARERSAMAELANERDSLVLRQEQIGERELSLERVREELIDLHREALEARLAAEATLVRLAGSAAPAAVSRSLAETRERLADHWRLVASRVADERAALGALRDDIAAQAKKLAAQRDELHAWAARRQQEFDQHTASLAAREARFCQLGEEIRGQRDRWHEERLAFERQLRASLGRLRDETESDERAAE
jgi:hypothetical protein